MALSPSFLALPQLLPVTHFGTPSPVQGCAKPRRGTLPRQTSQAVPWCSQLFRCLEVPLQPSSPLPHALSRRSLLSFCHLSPAEGVEWAVGVCFLDKVIGEPRGWGGQCAEGQETPQGQQQEVFSLFQPRPMSSFFFFFFPEFDVLSSPQILICIMGIMETERQKGRKQYPIFLLH